MRWFLAVTSLLVSVASTQAADQDTSADNTKGELHNVKGWDIRSWENEKGEWVYSLTKRTNRLKSVAEIRDSGLTGLDALKRKLRQLREGETVNWQHSAVQIEGKMELKYPQSEIMEDMRKFAESIKLKFQADVDHGQADVERKALDPELRRKLQKRVSFELVDAKLDDALATLRKNGEVTIIADPRVISSDHRINLRVTNMSFDLALQWVLERARLQYVVKENIIYISNAESLQDPVELQIYEVADIAAKHELNGEQVAALIQKQVSPGSWSEKDGTSVEARGDVLIVMHRPAAHKAIRKLLNAAREKLFDSLARPCR